MTSPDILPSAPTEPEHFVQLGQAHEQKGAIRQAQKAYGRALARDPGYWPAYFHRGRSFLNAGDHRRAIADFEKVLAINPDHANTCLLLGNSWSGLGETDRALAWFQQAAAQDPAYADAYYNAGVMQQSRDDLDAAVKSYAKALEHKPDFIMARSNLGVVLEARGDTDLALACYDAAIAVDPNHPSAHWNKALLLLRNGRYAEGWRCHEWRWGAGKAGPVRRYPGRPLWLGGTSLAGKTILLHAEQGLGDTIQFVRYAGLVAAAGARVVLETFLPLVGICRTVPGVAEVVGVGQALPDFDLHAPLMSLPLAFGTTVETIPGAIPYVAADPDHVALWQTRLGPRSRPRIGFAWKGNPRHDGDRARSMPVDLMVQALPEGVDLICLQKDLSPAEAAVLAARSDIRIVSEAFEDFDDTAAAGALCDLVIAVDTAIAHLAGAMGKPTWVLLAQRSDWRWLRARPDTPWYPTARLFRQAVQGDWSFVVDTVREALAEGARSGAESRQL